MILAFRIPEKRSTHGITGSRQPVPLPLPLREEPQPEDPQGLFHRQFREYLATNLEIATVDKRTLLLQYMDLTRFRHLYFCIFN